MKPGKAADLILTIPCLDRIALGIQEHIPGFRAIPKKCATAKDLIV